MKVYILDIDGAKIFSESIIEILHLLQLDVESIKFEKIQIFSKEMSEKEYHELPGWLKGIK